MTRKHIYLGWWFKHKVYNPGAVLPIVDDRRAMAEASLWPTLSEPASSAHIINHYIQERRTIMPFRQNHRS